MVIFENEAQSPDNYTSIYTGFKKCGYIFVENMQKLNGNKIDNDFLCVKKLYMFFRLDSDTHRIKQ